jgi:hypothetical protein
MTGGGSKTPGLRSVSGLLHSFFPSKVFVRCLVKYFYLERFAKEIPYEHTGLD